ncbi:hypothetical protein A0H81_11915 [Grifola frondosa]|uniref:Spindle pole body component n=1 Tax=Grifola frondosa TaxID=5627 RepID=A0A1C7LV10_GRIFR|nr:hypothetical protein A0H81_11915 [Grifola frondosa]
MESLHMLHDIRQSSKQVDIFPSEPQVLAEDIWTLSNCETEARDTLWETAAKAQSRDLNMTMSWDSLRLSSNSCSASSFLSEQSSTIFASARYHVRPSIFDPSTQQLHVTPQALLQSLQMTLSGTSSALHIWDSATESFVLRGIDRGRHGEMVLMGKDEVVTLSLVQRFLSIGTLMRRLEMLVAEQQENRGRAEPILHAFTHALSTILTYLRQNVEALPASVSEHATETLFALWMHYQDVEDILKALSALCHREEHLAPSAYNEMSSSPTNLLSAIYDHLNNHLDNQSPRIVTATFAYILTTTSRDYFVQLCDSVGYRTSQSTSNDPTLSRQPDSIRHFTVELDDDDPIDQEGLFDDMEGEGNADPFPVFVNPSLAETFRRARKSLKLLRAAKPDHELLTAGHCHPDIMWIWTLTEVETAWMNVTRESPPQLIKNDNANSNSSDNAASPVSHAGVLKAFQIFDLAPGDGLTADSKVGLFAIDHAYAATLEKSSAIASHPPYRRALWRSDVLFLDPSNHLNLHAHLILLRSYLLLTLHDFKLRLQCALFSDSDDRELASVGTRAFAARRYGLPRCEWKRERDFQSSGQIFDEAEYRVGFAIRDLPTGTGKEKWLNPLSIEYAALDFLIWITSRHILWYFDYAFHPVQISSNFAFNLRLMRVENVVRALYRMLLLHFRFVVCFRDIASSYVTTPMRNFDPFLSSLSTSNEPRRYADVFAITEQHSAVLDDILSACLLRSVWALEEYQAAPLLEDLWARFHKRMITLIKVLKALVDKGSLGDGVPSHDIQLQMLAGPLSHDAGLTGNLHNLLVRLDVAEWWTKSRDSE